ncbi:MAG: hypothetical protein ACE5DN_06935 [Flavobacteriales bacterium]
MNAFLRQKWVPFLLWSLATGLAAWYKLSFHELWKDEWQAWLLATKPDTLSEVFKMLPLEGHPPLWYLIQRGFHISLVSAGISLPGEQAIQLLHLAIYSGSLFILLVCFRLPLWMRLGFALTYFFGFEYGIVNRGYALVMLLGFLLSLYAVDFKKHTALCAALLFMLCMSEVYGLFMSLSFAFFMAMQQQEGAGLKKLLLLASSLSGSFVFLLLLTSPTAMGTYTLHQFSAFDWLSFVRSFQSLLVNVFWVGTVHTVQVGISVFGLLASTAILFILWFYFRQNKRLLTTYAVYFMPMFFFTSLVYPGGLRQWGMHLVFLVMMLQLDGFRFSALRGKLMGGFIISILLFHLPFNARILMRDYHFPFSNSIKAGRYLKEQIGKDAPVFVVNKFFCTPVAGYADRALYSFPDGKQFTYFRWREKLYIPDIRDLIYQKNRMGVSELLLLSYKPLDLLKYPGLKTVARFDQYNIRQENYYLYKY